MPSGILRFLFLISRYVGICAPIGSWRMRLPVAAKIALQSAGANGGTPGSPTPLDGTSMPCSTMCVRVIGRRLVDARRAGKSLKLLCSTRPFLKRDLAVFGERQPHHGRALDLRADALGVDAEAAVDRGIDARHRDVALVVDRDLDDGRDVADEAAMRGDAEPLTLRQLACPSRPSRPPARRPRRSRPVSIG